MDFFEHINEISILVSAILGVAIGSIWYSPVLFESFLGRSQNLDHVSQKKLALEAVFHVAILIAFFSILGYLATLLRDTALSFFKIAILLATLAIIQTLMLTIRERYTYTYFLAHAGYSVLVIFAGLSVMIYWPW